MAFEFISPEVDIYIGAAIVIAIFAFMVYLIARVKGRKDGGERGPAGPRGSRGSRGKKGDKGEPGGPEPKDKDFSEALNRLKFLLNQYNNMYGGFVNSCKHILNTHYRNVHSHNAYEPVDEEQWLNNHEWFEALNEQAREINNIFFMITNNSDFNRMVLEQKEEFVNLCNDWTNLLKKLSDFIDLFITKYENVELI